MRNEKPISPRLGGLGLRPKLVLGFVGLLAILLAVGVESITLLDRLGGSMAVLLLLGTALTGACIAFLFHWLLGPLERLTQAARRIEKGDLDQTVPVLTNDEIGQLAAAFNSMTESLRELRKSEQARLLRARRMAEVAIDNVPEAVAVLSADHRVELANRSAAALLGLRPGEPLPTRHGGWLPALLKRTEAGLIVAPGAEAEIRLPSDGRERFYRPRATILRDEPGQPESFVLVVEDVTALRRGGEMHAGLLAGAAGELGGALGPLRAALDALESGRPAPTRQQQDHLTGARNAAERLDQIAQSLQAMSRVEESRQQLHLEPIAPRVLIDAAAHSAAGGFERQRVQLTADVSPEAPCVLVDPERVGVAFSVLLQNALAHTAVGGSVTVRAEPDGGRARFTVSDTGNGIAPDDRGRIFEPFYQVPGTEHLGGVGLGLTVARDIVQAHGGEIHCDSEEGRGTTFWFTLPAAGGRMSGWLAPHPTKCSTSSRLTASGSSWITQWLASSK